MSYKITEEKIHLPHHEQQELCTTRLPYRQGRKFTAVKAYTINNESNHLLIFGVPSLNLRQEAKTLFLKFGKLLQFNQSINHPAEQFTETYHARYERVHSARIAKRMMDTKTFYGSSLHVCYAPEFETIEETKQKLMQRKNDVIYRLRNLKKDPVKETNTQIVLNDDKEETKKKINMGDVNTIVFKNNMNVSKRKLAQDVTIVKKFKPCFVSDVKGNRADDRNSVHNEHNNDSTNIHNGNRNNAIETVDCTSVDRPTVSNINEALNYNKFGNEDVRIVPQKPVNKIHFFIGNKKLS